MAVTWTWVNIVALLIFGGCLLLAIMLAVMDPPTRNVTTGFIAALSAGGIVLALR